MIEFLLMVNKQGQTRLSHYYGDKRIESSEKTILEAELVRRCLSRNDDECSSLLCLGYRIVYRRYASLYFIVGLKDDDAAINELAILEFIHCLVETFDRHFENVCELDIMFNLETAHFLLDEMIANGSIVETNRNAVLGPLRLMEFSANKA